MQAPTRTRRWRRLVALETCEPRNLMSVSDPIGDATQDLAYADVRAVGSDIDIVVRFAPGGFTVDKSNVGVLFDVDKNPATGFAGIDASHRDSAFIGTDFLLSLRDQDRTHARLLEYDAGSAEFVFRRLVDVKSIEDGVRMLVSRADLNSPDGLLHYKVTSSEQISATGSTGILDVLPDVGHAAGDSVWISELGRQVLDDAGDAEPDIVSARIRNVAGEVDMTIHFAARAFDPEKTSLTVGLDTDQNPWTGHPGVVSGGTVDKGVLGSDYVVDMWGERATAATIHKYVGPPINTFETVDRLQVIRFANGFRLRFPGATVHDDGNLQYKLMTAEYLGDGAFSGVRDVAPDVGKAAGTSIYTVPGDVDDNGAFESADLVAMLAAGRYEQDRYAHYEEGDLNGDGRFNTGDLVYVFMKGTYRPSPVRDLAAQRLEFEIIDRITRTRGEVQIRGYVRNVGNLEYRSSAGQQAALLYEIPLGGRPILVATMPFVNLGPGQETEVSFTRSWDSSSPNEGEFPPDYRLVISYDPDILLDGTPFNNDEAAANNSRTRSGSAINDLFV